MIKNQGKSSDATEADSAAVARYLETLTHPLKPEIEALRRIILRADKHITEGIKWNVPSFYCGEWFATFDLRSKERVQIVFHRGAQVKRIGDTRYVKDPDRILQWITNDRCIAKFTTKAEVAAQTKALAGIVAEWVENLRQELPAK